MSCQTNPQITDIPWLAPANTLPISKLSRSDFNKRTEFLSEFLYWLFDSIIIHLIRTNFYVTETAVHRNRVFYFRHDIWRQISAPSITKLKHTMLHPITKVCPFTDETKSRMKRCWFCRMRRESLWATRSWDSCRRSRVWDVSPISDDEHINWLEPWRQNWENRNRIWLEDRDSKSFLVRASILSCNQSSAFSILKRNPSQERKIWF